MREHRAKLSVLFLIVFVDLVGFGMIIPVLPLYAEVLGAEPGAMALLMASFSIMQFVFNPVLGRLSDRYGRRPVLLISLLGSAAGYALLSVADSMALLLASRVVAGIFAANISTAQAVIADITGPEGRAKGMGIIGAAFGLGFILGPGIGALLDVIAPWLPGAAATFFSLLAFVLTWFLLPETRRRRAPDEAPRLDAPSFWTTIAAPGMALALGIVLFAVTAFSMFEVTFAQFLERLFGFDPEHDRERIYIFFVYAGVLGALIQGGLVGRLARRFGEGRLVVWGAGIAALSMVMLPFVGSIAAVLVVLALLALGQGMLNPSLSALVSRVADEDAVGGAMGLYQAFSSLGRIIGPFGGQLALGWLGLAWPYWLAGGLDLLALLLSIALVARFGADKLSKKLVGKPDAKTAERAGEAV